MHNENGPKEWQDPEENPDTCFVELGAEAAEEETIARAKQHYAQQEEEKRKNSPHRVRPSGEVFNPKKRTWEKLGE